MTTQQESLVEKPFGFVSFPEADINAHRSAPPGHDVVDSDLLSGTIRGLITALTPIHVGSGVIELIDRIDRSLARETPLVKGFVRSGGRRVIPGTSLKGAIRSIYEAVTISCVAKADRRTQIPPAFRECRNAKKLCPACRAFGAMGYLGRVSFADAPQINGGVEVIGTPALYGPRTPDPSPGRKFYVHAHPGGGNTPLEACTAGSQFVLQVDFENLASRELGTLLIALGQGRPAIRPKLGGGKPVGYGSLEIAEVDLHVYPAREVYLNFEVPAESVDPEIYTEAALQARDYLLRPQLNELLEILAWPTDRRAPEGPY